LLAEAQEPYLKGEYENAIKIFDEYWKFILQILKFLK